MRLKTRAVSFLAVACLAAAGVSLFGSGTAHAASGGGCNGTPSGSGSISVVYACVSASGFAKLTGDGYVYQRYVPSGCIFVDLTIHDYNTGWAGTYGAYQDCSTSFHIPATTLGEIQDKFYTTVEIFNSNWNEIFISDTSPLEQMP